MLRVWVRELESNFNNMILFRWVTLLYWNTSEEKDKQTLKKCSVQGSVEIDENEEHIYRQDSMKECRG